MKFISRRGLIKGGAAAALGRATIASSSPRGEPRVMERDVCILGAGASGMYAAGRLKEMGYSVVVLEKLDRVGGHAHTHKDAATGEFQEMGVRIFPDVDIIQKTYKRYGIRLNRIDLNQGKRKYVDIRTGKESGFKTPNVFKILYSLLKYEILAHTKFKYVYKEGFELPDDLSEELLMPFGEYLRKHKINEGFAPVTHYLQGYGRVKDLLTIYAYKNMKPYITQNIRQNSFVAPENGASEIYEKIAAELEGDVILQSSLQSVRRGEDFVEVLADTPNGLVSVKSKKLIVSFAPMLKNMEVLDLDEKERDIFSRFKSGYYWTALARFDNVPEKTILFNVASTDILEGQIFPGMYSTVPTSIPGQWNILFGSPDNLSEDEVKARIVNDMENMSGDGKVLPAGVTFQGFTKFLNHTPFGLTVSADDIRGGFYKRLTALQGLKNTFYLGAALDTNDTSSVWLHAEKIVKDHFQKA